MWKHWVARSSTPYSPFQESEAARWFWNRLECLFPDMIAAVLMPNHFHLILPANLNDKTIYFQLNGLLGATSSKMGMKKLWQAMPEPAEIPDIAHLRRQMRYVALNPCRKNLCKDPLEWYWSTYRNLVGAAISSGPSAAQIARTLREPAKNFAVRFHSYVSGDPSVAVLGTPFPKSAMPKDWAENSIGEILAAAAAALRVSPVEVRRKSQLRILFIHLAMRHGWWRSSDLAKICGISASAIRELKRSPCPSGISAAELCLGDRRFRQEETVSFVNTLGGRVRRFGGERHVKKGVC